MALSLHFPTCRSILTARLTNATTFQWETMNRTTEIVKKVENQRDTGSWAR